MNNIIEIRNSRFCEIDKIMEVYESARKFMRRSGNMTQWTGGYPSRELILSDIENGIHYIGFDDNGEVMMVFSFYIADGSPRLAFHKQLTIDF